MKDPIGQIKISFPEKGIPEVEIIGKVGPRQMRTLPMFTKRAYRRHIHALHKISLAAQEEGVDTGTKIADLTKEEFEKANTPTPNPNIHLNISTATESEETLVVKDDLKETSTEEANKPKQSEVADGTNKEAAGIRRHDGQPGRQERLGKK